MPGLSLSLNGKHLVTVSAEGLNVLAIRVHGDVVGSEFASIYVNGGHYGERDDNKHFIWINEREITSRDEVEVRFLEEASTSHSGQTIEELYPEEANGTGPRQSIEELFRDLAKKPKVRNKYAFRVQLPSGETAAFCTGPNDHSFGFSVLWDCDVPP